MKSTKRIAGKWAAVFTTIPFLVTTVAPGLISITAEAKSKAADTWDTLSTVGKGAFQDKYGKVSNIDLADILGNAQQTPAQKAQKVVDHCRAKYAVETALNEVLDSDIINKSLSAIEKRKNKKKEKAGKDTTKEKFTCDSKPEEVDEAPSCTSLLNQESVAIPSEGKVATYKWKNKSAFEKKQKVADENLRLLQWQRDNDCLNAGIKQAETDKKILDCMSDLLGQIVKASDDELRTILTMARGNFERQVNEEEAIQGQMKEIAMELGGEDGKSGLMGAKDLIRSSRDQLNQAMTEAVTERDEITNNKLANEQAAEKMGFDEVNVCMGLSTSAVEGGSAATCYKPVLDKDGKPTGRNNYSQCSVLENVSAVVSDQLRGNQRNSAKLKRKAEDFRIQFENQMRSMARQLGAGDVAGQAPRLKSWEELKTNSMPQMQALFAQYGVSGNVYQQMESLAKNCFANAKNRIKREKSPSSPDTAYNKRLRELNIQAKQNNVKMKSSMDRMLDVYSQVTRAMRIPGQSCSPGLSVESCFKGKLASLDQIEKGSAGIGQINKKMVGGEPMMCGSLDSCIERMNARMDARKTNLTLKQGVRQQTTSKANETFDATKLARSSVVQGLQSAVEAQFAKLKDSIQSQLGISATGSIEYKDPADLEMVKYKDQVGPFELPKKGGSLLGIPIMDRTKSDGVTDVLKQAADAKKEKKTEFETKLKEAKEKQKNYKNAFEEADQGACGQGKTIAIGSSADADDELSNLEMCDNCALLANTCAGTATTVEEKEVKKAQQLLENYKKDLTKINDKIKSQGSQNEAETKSIDELELKIKDAEKDLEVAKASSDAVKTDATGFTTSLKDVLNALKKDEKNLSPDDYKSANESIDKMIAASSGLGCDKDDLKECKRCANTKKKNYDTRQKELEESRNIKGN
jgi:hypothetical protein